jgi:hypothetical protein
MKWLARIDALTTIANREAILRWNSHKRYLNHLTEKGVPSVPSVCLPSGSTAREVPHIHTDSHHLPN